MSTTRKFIEDQRMRSFSINLFNLAFERSFSSQLLVDQRGMVITASDRCAEALKYESGRAMHGFNVQRLLPAHDREGLKMAFCGFMAMGVPEDGPWGPINEARCGDGSIIAVRVRARRIKIDAKEGYPYAIIEVIPET